MIIGINGNPGSGKTTISNLLFLNEDKKIIHLDSVFDEIKRKYFEKYTVSLETNSGDNMIFLDDTTSLKRLLTSKYLNYLYNSLRAYYANILVRGSINKSKNTKYLILEGTGLKIYNLEKLCDVKVFVNVDSKIQFERVLKRNIYQDEATILRQLDKNDQEHLDHSDYLTIYNNGSFDELKESVKVLEDKIKIKM